MVTKVYSMMLLQKNTVGKDLCYTRHILMAEGIIDRIVSDIQMPKMDGIALSNALFKFIRNQKIVLNRLGESKGI
jgi:CheY-like chemotaxis protein